MKKIKINGFTLIELLAVIVIIGIVTMMAVPNVMKVFSQKKETLYTTTVSEIERLSGVYITENPSMYSTINDNGYVDITLESLCNGKYITCPITDPRDNSVITGYVRVSFVDDDYIYEFVRS